MAQRRRSGWLWYVVFALLAGAYLGLNQRLNHLDLPAWMSYVWEYSSVLVIAALIPLVVRFERRFPIDSHPRGRIIAAHIAGMILFSVAHIVSFVVLRKLAFAVAGESYEFGNLPLRAFYEGQKDVIFYLMILLVVFAAREFRVRRAEELRAAELATALSAARLQHLTAQIEPHFLFNTLNAISNRMHEDVGAADRMISQLANLMRAAYDTDNQSMVPLDNELEWLRGYAAMMEERFRGQLVFRLDVEPNLEDISVPRLLLQPVVENAFRHGLGAGRGCLSVEVRRLSRHLCYTISDDGVGLPETVSTRGTGLSNVSRRLELLFPSDHELTVCARATGGTVVKILFPILG